MEKPVLDSEEPKIPATYYANKSKYVKSVITNDTTKFSKAVIEVKETTDIKQLIAFSIDLMYNKQFPHVKLRGFGKNMEKCVFVAEQMKRKVRNLHQINVIETIQITERFVPQVEAEGYYAFEKVKNQTVLNITLSRQTPLNLKQAGYQKPLESKFVSTRDPREYIRYVLEEKKVPTKKRLMAEKREGKPFKMEGEFDDDPHGDEGFREGHAEDEESQKQKQWQTMFEGPKYYRPGKGNNQGRLFYGNKEKDGEAAQKKPAEATDGQKKDKPEGEKEAQAPARDRDWDRDRDQRPPQRHHEGGRDFHPKERHQSSHGGRRWDSQRDRNDDYDRPYGKEAEHAENWDDPVHTESNGRQQGRFWRGHSGYKSQRYNDSNKDHFNDPRDNHRPNDRPYKSKPHHNHHHNDRREDNPHWQPQRDHPHPQDRPQQWQSQRDHPHDRPQHWQSQRDHPQDRPQTQVEVKVTLNKFEPKPKPAYKKDRQRPQDDYQYNESQKREDRPKTTAAPHPEGESSPSQPPQGGDSSAPHHRPAKKPKHPKWRKQVDYEYVEKPE